MKKIIVYCEVNQADKTLNDVSYELISKACELCENVSNAFKDKAYFVEAVALGSFVESASIDKTFACGASRFVLIKNNYLDNFYQTTHADAFCQYFKQNPSEIIIFPATPKGRIVAPRITAILNTGLVADCTDLMFVVQNDELKFAPTRPTFGSELMATIISKQDPQCATVRPGIFEADFTKRFRPNYAEFYPEIIEENRIKLIDSFKDKTKLIQRIADAKIVLVGGYGLVDNKLGTYFTKLEKLAQKIGAEVGSTKKVVDLGFMAKETQVGQTGQTIAPELYISFGVSGAIQHTIGMKKSKTVIAINTDEKADIFNFADYKIVADAKQIIDELLSELSI